LNELLRRLQDEGKLSHFTVHDLRHTASTHLHEAGFAADVIEKASAHTIGGARGVYNRASYAEQRKVLLQQRADMLESWATDAEKVVPLGRVA
jgi:integrase